jgi:hypothetical protein
VGLLVVLAAVAVGLFVVLSGGDDDDGGGEETTTSQTVTTTAEPAFTVIRMKDGAPVGGTKELTYEKGDQVRIEVKLDEPQEDVHIHGYEIEKLNPSGTVKFDFKADLDGLFELEAHGPSGDVLLAEIRVNP